MTWGLVKFHSASVVLGSGLWSYEKIIIAVWDRKQSLHLHKYSFSGEGPYENGLCPDSRAGAPAEVGRTNGLQCTH